MCKLCFHISYILLKITVRIKFSAAGHKSPGFVNPIFKTILRAFRNFRVALSFHHLVPIISERRTWALWVLLKCFFLVPKSHPMICNVWYQFLGRKDWVKSVQFILCIPFLAAVWNNSLDFGRLYPDSTGTAAGMGNVCGSDSVVPLHCLPLCVPLWLCK